MSPTRLDAVVGDGRTRRLAVQRFRADRETSTSPSSAPATPGCGPPVLVRRRPGAARRRRRARHGRLRGQRTQRRLVLGAAPGRARHRSRRHGREAAVALQRAMIDTVDEVGGSPRRVGDEFHQGGTLALARNAAQLRRLDEVDERAEFGFGDDDCRLLDADEARRVRGPPTRSPPSSHRTAPRSTRCGSPTPSPPPPRAPGCASLEGTRVDEIGPGRLTTPAGTVRAGRRAGDRGLHRRSCRVGGAMCCRCTR